MHATTVSAHHTHVHTCTSHMRIRAPFDPIQNSVHATNTYRHTCGPHSTELIETMESQSKTWRRRTSLLEWSKWTEQKYHRFRKYTSILLACGIIMLSVHQWFLAYTNGESINLISIFFVYRLHFSDVRISFTKFRYAEKMIEASAEQLLLPCRVLYETVVTYASFDIPLLIPLYSGHQKAISITHAPILKRIYIYYLNFEDVTLIFWLCSWFDFAISIRKPLGKRWKRPNPLFFARRNRAISIFDIGLWRKHIV